LDKAVSRMDAAHKRDNEKAAILCFRALVEWVREDRDAAIRDWEEAARLDPKNEESRTWLRKAGVEPPPSR
jgi:tetratricopeptide (TPR) repeat protein